MDHPPAELAAVEAEKRAEGCQFAAPARRPAELAAVEAEKRAERCQFAVGG